MKPVKPDHLSGAAVPEQTGYGQARPLEPAMPAGTPSCAGALGYFGLVFIVALCYAVLRFTYNFTVGTTWQDIYDLAIAVPFGNRILVPVLSRPLVWAGCSLYRTYQFWEVVSAFLLIWGLARVFRLFVEDRWARWLSIGVAYALVLVFLLFNRLSFLYPWDTPAMAFVVWGLYFLFRGNWPATVVLLLAATLNRESSILIPLLFAVFYADRLPLKRFVVVLMAMAGSYCLARYLVNLTTVDNIGAGQFRQMSLVEDCTWRVNNNIAWLMLEKKNFLVLLATLAGLPVAFLALFRWIPRHMRRIGPVALAYFAMLFFIGNVEESRIYGEITCLLYVAVALGGYRYLTGRACAEAGCLYSRLPPAALATTARYLLAWSPAILIAFALAMYGVLNGWLGAPR